jgi:hypothetical protein
MKKKTSRFCLGSLSAILCAAGMAFAKDPAANGAQRPEGRPARLRIFIDGSGGGGGGDYVRTEIPFVEYVRDRKDADVHTISTTLSSGAGSETKIEFIGLGAFKDIHYTLAYFVDRLATRDERREAVVRVLKKGLMPFVARTEIEEQVSVSFKESAAKPADPAKDPWDRWMFGVNLNGSFNGEELQGSSSYDGGFSLNRVTEDLKINASWQKSVYDSRYTIEDQEIRTSSRSWRFGGLVVKSLNDHWSIGGWVSASSSTYSNEKTSLRIAPALEFDVFPYAESTRKRLTFLYRLNFGRYAYLEETIYGKLSESLLSQSLSVSLNVIQPWGNANASIVGSHYFHDFSKNRLSVYGSLSVRIWKGFSVYTSGGFSMIHDQLSLVKGALSSDEILLRLKQMSTTYSYYMSLGISFSFGSTLRGAVNPRFGSGYYE